jgi:hypothetical protein
MNIALFRDVTPILISLNRQHTFTIQNGFTSRNTSKVVVTKREMYIIVEMTPCRLVGTPTFRTNIQDPTSR